MVPETSPRMLDNLPWRDAGAEYENSGYNDVNIEQVTVYPGDMLIVDTHSWYHSTKVYFLRKLTVSMKKKQSF